MKSISEALFDYYFNLAFAEYFIFKKKSINQSHKICRTKFSLKLLAIKDLALSEKKHEGYTKQSASTHHYQNIKWTDINKTHCNDLNLESTACRILKSCCSFYPARGNVTTVTESSQVWRRGLPDAPMGEVAGVMLWTLRPRLWEGPGADAAIGGPGGFSRWGEVRGVVGWEVCPPASRARRLRRIYNEGERAFCEKQQKHNSAWE